MLGKKKKEKGEKEKKTASAVWVKVIFPVSDFKIISLTFPLRQHMQSCAGTKKQQQQKS
jgi:hypothetical protein